MDLDEESSMTSLASSTVQPEPSAIGSSTRSPEDLDLAQVGPSTSASQIDNDRDLGTAPVENAGDEQTTLVPSGYTASAPPPNMETAATNTHSVIMAELPGSIDAPGVVRDLPQSSSSTPVAPGRARGPGRPRGSRAKGTPRGTPRGSARGTGRGASVSSHAARGRKRKRGRSDDDDHGDDDDGSSDSSVEITPVATQTKSGRSIQKPATFVPALTNTSTGRGASTGSPWSGNGVVPVPGAVQNGSVKKKRIYRRNPEAAVCKVCLRGVSPATNMIVFCDGCNSPYHRYCHHPTIDQTVIDQVDKEWYCRNCVKPEVPPARSSLQTSQTPLTNGPTAHDVSSFVVADSSLRQDEAEICLQALSQKTLARLLAKAYTLKPDLAIFPPDYKNRLASTTTASRASGSRATTETDGKASSDYDHVPIEHPDHYPRPGHGLMSKLPPDTVDAAVLVDAEDKYGAFSHVYQTDPMAANTGINGTSGV